jgi:hypothetical protein
MTVPDISTVANILAAIGVMGSLVFVGLQVRQSNRQMREAAIRHHVDRIAGIGLALSESADLADLWVRGLKDLDALTPPERARFINYFTYALRIWEQLHLQNLTGVMDRELWDANVKILADIRNTPGTMAAWKIRRHIFTPRFQAFYESLDLSGAKQLYGDARQ